MSQALTQYNAMYEAMRSRRIRPPSYKGLDRVASRGLMLLRHRKMRSGVLSAMADSVLALEGEMHNLSEAALDDGVERIREQFLRGRHDHERVVRAMAIVREVARRATGQEAFRVQVIGALALYHGRIIEMLTGEGKTLTGSIAAPLIAWERRHLHVFTVNDYLAARDAESRRGIYRRCLLDVGAITQETDPGERFAIYAKPIVYGTPKQITADYLRDQIRMGPLRSPWAGRTAMALSQSGGGGGGMGGGGASNIAPMIPGLRAALVDEADAVLIDEGVVPLIIARSRREDEMAQIYAAARRMALKLDNGPDYTVDKVRRKAELKRRGEERCEQMFAETLERGGDPIWKATRRGEELIKQALVAEHCYHRGQQYEIVDGKVVIVDEYTGRFLADRSWEHGLHQSVEAKEGVEITADRETLARMSFQRFYRSYPFLCGMTGTAADAIGEIESVYSRPVTVIPTNKPVIRAEWPMRIFATARDKWDAIVASIETIHMEGRPILVGTRSIAASELLSRLLDERGLEHQVLNANFDKEEAELIARAGQGGSPGVKGEAAITVATNMAGRGTDIMLDHKGRRTGGLHVLLTEMHGARRIDRQFIGRAGRQGDPGSAQIFVSLEDELVQNFARSAAAVAKTRAGGPELSGGSGNRAIFALAQRRSQARDRRNRAGVLRQDDWIDKNLPGVG